MRANLRIRLLPSALFCVLFLGLATRSLSAQKRFEGSVWFAVEEYTDKYGGSGTYRGFFFNCDRDECFLMEERVEQCFDTSTRPISNYEYTADKQSRATFSAEATDSSLVLHVIQVSGPKMELTVKMKRGPFKDSGIFEATSVTGAVVYPGGKWVRLLRLSEANGGGDSFVLPCRIKFSGARQRQEK